MRWWAYAAEEDAGGRPVEVWLESRVPPAGCRSAWYPDIWRVGWAPAKDCGLVLAWYPVIKSLWRVAWGPANEGWYLVPADDFLLSAGDCELVSR